MSEWCPGEFAVFYSHRAGGAVPEGETCLIFASLGEAVDHARMAVLESATLQCRVYDHHGFGGAPAAIIAGSQHRGESGISARFRRVAGAALLLGGLGLVALDWVNDFRLTWPATLGARMAPVGLILLVTELAIVLSARQKLRRAAAKSSSDGRNARMF